MASIEAVCQRFVELHTINAMYLEHLDQRILELEAKIQQGAVVLQAERRACLAEKKQYRKSLGARTKTVDEILEDFWDIIEHDRVLGVDLGHANSIEVTIRATIEYQSMGYFIGDWVFAFGHEERQEDNGFNSNGLFGSWCVESGVKEDPYSYPDYTLCGYGEDAENPFGFCFGPLAGRIGLHLVRGEIKSAVFMAMLSFCSVNEQDKPKIPERFYSFDEIRREVM